MERKENSKLTYDVFVETRAQPPNESAERKGGSIKTINHTQSKGKGIKGEITHNSLICFVFQYASPVAEPMLRHSVIQAE
jgi:hypothetical protein